MAFHRKIGYVVLLAWLSAGCGGSSSSPSGGKFDLTRLAGRWEFMDNKTHQIEEWELVTDNELNGRGFVLEGNDTTFIEFLSIKEENGQLIYFARPSDLMSAEVIPFALEQSGNDKLIFANINNDFPKKIVYEFQSDSIMQVYIEGPRDGKTTRIFFDFIKQKSV